MSRLAATHSVRTHHGGRQDRDIPFGGNSMQHGTAVFEGIRCYPTPDGPRVFRLDDHLARLRRSAELIGIPGVPSMAELRTQVLAAVPDSAEHPGCYLRPVLYAPDPVLGLDLRTLRFQLGVEVWPADTVADHPGLALTVSPWRRPPGECLPVGAKVTGAYAMSAVARTHAAHAGFDDAVQLDPHTGRVAEATVANIFLVHGGRLSTPWLRDGPLPGITRDTVLTLAAELGIEAGESPVEVGDMRAADEIFLTGTFIELVPARSLDGREFDPGGPVFRALFDRFRDTVSGAQSAHLDWLTAPDILTSSTR